MLAASQEKEPRQQQADEQPRHNPVLAIIPVELPNISQITHAAILEYAELEFGEAVFAQTIGQDHADDALGGFLQAQVLRTLGCALEDLLEMVRIVVDARHRQRVAQSHNHAPSTDSSGVLVL
jgi:cytochrome b